MAFSVESAGEIILAALRRLLRKSAGNRRLMGAICAALAVTSFMAAAIVEMRLDRSRALTETIHFERARARDIASVAGAALDRYARAGAAYAEDHAGDIARTEPGIRNIAVFDAGGALLAQRGGANGAVPALSPEALGAQRAVFAGGLAFHDGQRVVMVLFDPASLAPASLFADAALQESGGRLFAGGPGWHGGESLHAAVPGWPLAAAVAIDQGGVPDQRYGNLPLYLLMMLGPAVTGGWVAASFVGRLQRRDKAARGARALLSTRPQEARLLVRLANAERGAAEALRSKTEFIAHMTHELRTPLNAIIGFSDIIAHGFFGPTGHPKYDEYARDIGDAGRSLHTKIGDILEFANIEAGRQPLEVGTVDLAAMAGQCIAEQQGRAFSRGVELATGVCEPGTVQADALAVKRIFANLISNALTYTGKGGTVCLDVRFEEGAGVARLRDSGMGFSERERKKAGRAFQRFDRPGTVTGAGLGLAIAVELARRMGGAMRLASRPGGGSVMELRLPRTG